MSVDPETRRKLLLLQKSDENKRCADCDAFNPQWALPKFGIFICLECAGIHRGLGVHISFVRSITMDQFKPEEVLRMEKGGNGNCRRYLEEHGVDPLHPQKAKYDNDVADDYKQLLLCLIEGKPFVAPDRSAQQPRAELRGANTPISVDRAQTEAYLERVRSENGRRPENLPPSQGGRYAGFGNTPAGLSGQQNGEKFSVESLQQDPLGTLTKGWSLFSSTVAKSVSEVHESVIKPGFLHLQESDLGAETKRAMAQFGQKMQQTGKYGQETFLTFTREVQGKGFNDTVGSFFGSAAGQVDRAFGFKKPENEKKMLSLDSQSLLNHKKGEDDWDEF